MHTLIIVQKTNLRFMINDVKNLKKILFNTTFDYGGLLFGIQLQNLPKN